MDNCIFCKIASGVVPAHNIYEDENIVAFLDIHPTVFGHTLIIPKKHFEWIQETPDDLLSYVFLKVKFIIRSFKQKLNCDYVQVSIVGKDVPHFHVHLMPKMLDETKNLEEVLEISKKDFEQISKVLAI